MPQAASQGADQVVLKVRGLSHSYPGRHVFTHWSADIAPGLTWLRGPNGCGKSTLLKLLAGALPPLTGTLAVRGVDAAADPLGYRREVFWCGPGAIAFDHLRPLEYTGFLQTLYPRWDAAALPDWLQRLGLQPFLHTRLAAMSTGTQRKLALAAALVSGCAVVLLDEPLNALDSASLAQLRSGLLAVHAGAGQAGRQERPQAWLVASHEPLLPATALPELLLHAPPA